MTLQWNLSKADTIGADGVCCIKDLRFIENILLVQKQLSTVHYREFPL